MYIFRKIPLFYISRTQTKHIFSSFLFPRGTLKSQNTLFYISQYFVIAINFYLDATLWLFPFITRCRLPSHWTPLRYATHCDLRWITDNNPFRKLGIDVPVSKVTKINTLLKYNFLIFGRERNHHKFIIWLIYNTSWKIMVISLPNIMQKLRKLYFKSLLSSLTFNASCIRVYERAYCSRGRTPHRKVNNANFEQTYLS